VRASSLPGIFKYIEKGFAPERITASWEALYRWSRWIRTDQFTAAVPSTDMEWMFTMGSAIKHYLNPLHICCRLRDLGIGKCLASFLCQFYERIIFNKYFLVRDWVLANWRMKSKSLVLSAHMDEKVILWRILPLMNTRASLMKNYQKHSKKKLG